MRHVQFRGTIRGRVPLRPGETKSEAVERAQDALLALTAQKARRLRVQVALTEFVPPAGEEAA